MLDLMHLAFLNSHLVLGASDPLEWLKNLGSTAKEYGGQILAFLGICCIVYAGWALFRGVTAKSNKGKHFITFGACAIVAVVLIGGGMKYIQTIGDSGYSAVKKVTK